MTEFAIVPLAAEHDRSQFDCGEPTLNDFIRLHATQYERRHLGRTFVAVEIGKPRVDGFYTISAGAVAFETWPDHVRRKLPRHPMPVIHLGRLAVDRKCRGIRLGETLLIDALQRSHKLAQTVGVFAVEVIAVDQAAKSFYLKYGFVPLLDDPQHLYMSMKTINALANP